MMMKSALVLVLLLTVAPAALATCNYTAPGLFWSYYNHTLNGDPLEDECWNSYHMVFVEPYLCGAFRKSFQFGYAGSISQSIVVPNNQSASNWEFNWQYDFDDPNNDSANNSLSVTVRNVTTNTVLGTFYYNGGMSDAFCEQGAIQFSGNFAGHTIMVSFSGSTGYSNTKIRVRNMALWQW
jgi:hypothetical protein